MELFNKLKPGVLAKKQLKYIASGDNRIITDATLDDEPESAFDLHISNKYWKMNGSIKGLGVCNSFSKVLEQEHYCVGPFNFDTALKLEKKSTYVFEIVENLKYEGAFSGRIHGYATGKSSIGRLDVLTRLITEYSNSYDIVPNINPGKLFLEVTPITYNIVVKPFLSLNQLRLIYGNPALSEIRLNEIASGYWGEVILDPLGNPLKAKVDTLTLNLANKKSEENEIIAFKALNDDGLTVDLTKDYSNPDNLIDPHEFWEPIYSNKNDNYIEIHDGRFYILKSKERFILPDDIAVYCQAVSEEIGEIRIHYAGFVHPGFGQLRDDNKGAPLIFEVRGHTLKKSFLRDGERLAVLNYYRMSEIDEITKPAYTNQELKLSKYFKDWE
jgi:dCTP deaminase